MGDKRVKKLLLTYKDLKTIGNSKPINIQNDIGVSEIIAKIIVSIAKKNSQ
jgi:hypothetical protein